MFLRSVRLKARESKAKARSSNRMAQMSFKSPSLFIVCFIKKACFLKQAFFVVSASDDAAMLFFYLSCSGFPFYVIIGLDPIIQV